MHTLVKAALEKRRSGKKRGKINFPFRFLFNKTDKNICEREDGDVLVVVVAVV